MNALLAVLAFLLQDPTRDQIVQKDIERAVAKLDSQIYLESYTAKIDLVELGRKATPALLKALAEAKAKPEKAQLRRAVCEIFAATRDNSKEVVDAMTAALEDRDEFGISVASAAASALAAIGDERAGPALVNVLKSKDVDVDKYLKVQTIHALAALRILEASEELRKALSDKTSDRDDEDGRLVAAAAAQALGKVRSGGAIEDLIRCLDGMDQDRLSGKPLRWHAAAALERIMGDGKGSLDDPAQESKAIDEWKKWGEDWKRQKARSEAPAKISETQKRLQELDGAVKKFHGDFGRIPNLLIELVAIPAEISKDPEKKKKWPEGGYYKGPPNARSVPIDAWDREFVYVLKRTPHNDYDLLSWGLDGREWGADVDADLWADVKMRENRVKECLNVTKNRMDDLVKAIETFQKDNQEVPNKLAHLVGKPVGPEGSYIKQWPQNPYVKEREKLTDGFGREFIYRKPGLSGEPYDLGSHGSDGVEGGTGDAEDLWNHSKREKK